ncbi:unnamed protein product, partial [marine sediment metagenome]
CENELLLTASKIISIEACIIENNMTLSPSINAPSGLQIDEV